MFFFIQESKPYDFIPITSDEQGILSIAKFYEEYSLQKNLSVSLHLDFIYGNMCAPLAAVLHLLKKRNNNFVFKYKQKNLYDFLNHNCFLYKMGFSTELGLVKTTSIPFNIFLDARGFTEDLLKNDWTKRLSSFISNGLRTKILSNLTEINNNAFDHGETSCLFTCGQFFPKIGELHYCLTDIGKGFKTKISNFLKKEISSKDAISWAMEEGNTTRLDSPGGLGLKLLRDFLKLNKGSFLIASQDGFYKQDSDGSIYCSDLEYPFPGSIALITINTSDSRSYRLSNEPKKEVLL